jgi:hypothetical protein
MWSALLHRLWERLLRLLRGERHSRSGRESARPPGQRTGSGAVAPRHPLPVQPTQFPKRQPPSPKLSEHRAPGASVSRGNHAEVVEDLVWLGLPWRYLRPTRRS